WTGEQTFAGNFLNSVAIYNAGLFALVSFWQWCFAGTGLVRTIIPYMLCQAVVNISLSLLLTKFIGMEGPVLGTLIAFQVVTIPWQTYLMKRIFDVPYYDLTKAWFLPFVVPVGCSILLSKFIDYPVLESWSVFFLGSFALYLFCGITFLFVF